MHNTGQDTAAVQGTEAQANSKDVRIMEAKQFRRMFDDNLQSLKTFRDVLGRGEPARHASIAVTACEDVIMRLGMTLKYLGTEDPYPNSKDPSNTIVDPTADGLTM